MCLFVLPAAATNLNINAIIAELFMKKANIARNAELSPALKLKNALFAERNIIRQLAQIADILLPKIRKAIMIIMPQAQI